jgi:hypothetical protein
MLCRLWGATETMPCPFGCEPDGPPLTPEQEFALFVYSLAVGGGSRVGWPQVFDPERVMDAYRADAGGVRSRFLAGRAAARENIRRSPWQVVAPPARVVSPPRGETEMQTWTRSLHGPKYTAQLTRGRTAEITKIRLVVGFAWQATVTTARGDSYRVCREATLRDCREMFAECGQRGRTCWGRDFTLW